MYSKQIFILFLLLNSVYGKQKTSSFKQQLHQLRKPLIVPDYDNRYVWFTRNIHSKRRNQDENHKNNFNGFLYHKESTLKVENLITT